MFYIGCHLSSAGGYLAMGKEATELGANTFAFFTRNPRGGASKIFNPDDAASLVAYMKENGFGRLVAHSPYTLNAASAEEKTRKFALEVFADDLSVMEHLPGNLYNFHPGSHVGQGTDIGIGYILHMLNACMSRDMTTTVLLETMAGKGSEIGGSFTELRRIIDGCEYAEHLGVCLDTCHISDGGYDIIGNLSGVLEEFDRVVGIDRIKAIHLNDSKNDPGSHKDRHEKIGQGHIGLETLVNVINRPEFKNLPFILETPNEPEGYKAEIALLRKHYRQ